MKTMPLTTLKESKTFARPRETILLSVKDESGAVLSRKSTEINNIHM
ncbi:MULTISPECIES: hypothetical protein [Vibrio]|nr:MULTISPECIES: hypothetical protein [Vibrio]